MMSNQSFNNEAFAYSSDIPIRFIELVAKALFSIIGKITFKAVDKKITPLSIVITIYIVVDLVAIVSTTIQGTFFIYASNNMSVAIYVLSPIGVALVYRFYKRLLPVLDEIIKAGTIHVQEENVNDFLNALYNRLNSRLWAIICFILGLFIYLFWLYVLPLLQIESGFKTGGFPILKIYVSFWGILLYSVLFFFAYKVIVIWQLIYNLAVNSVEGSKEPHFQVDMGHEDGCAGFKMLSLLWLNVNLVVTIVGTGIIVYAFDHGLNTWFWLLLIIYIIVGISLFFAPYSKLHSLMLAKKDILYREHKHHQVRKNIPEWPFNLRIKKSFWIIHLLPVYGVLIIELLKLFKIID
jgi:hypothetical protein